MNCLVDSKIFFIFVSMFNENKKTYWELLPLAYKIYYTLYGQPKTHEEWAKGFNIRGKIIKTLLE